MKVEILPYKYRGFNRFYNITLTRDEIIQLPNPYLAIRVENSDLHFILFPGEDMGETFEVCPPGLPEGFFSFLGTDHQGKPPREWELSDLVKSVQRSYPKPIRAYGGHTGIQFDGMVVYSIEEKPMTMSYAVYEFFKRRDERLARSLQNQHQDHSYALQSLQP